MKHDNTAIQQEINKAIKKYLHQCQGCHDASLYQEFIYQVESALLSTVLEHTDGNQSNAADILGISRTTLRKKIKTYQL